MIDLISPIFKDAVVAGVPLLLLVFGLVQWVKGFGLAGNTVRAVSMVIGILLGVGYNLSAGPVVGFAGWFAATVFGLMLGLAASGIYDAGT